MSNILDLPLEREKLLEMFTDMVATRYLEDRLAEDVKSPKKHCIGTAYLARGHEAYSCGMAHALEEGDTFCPSHRDCGALLVLGKPLKRAALRRFLNYFGKKDSSTRGVDGSVHDHDKERGVFTFISHMGASAGVAVGQAFTLLTEGKENMAVVSFGEGASSQGRVHEAMNLAGTLKFVAKRLPIVFCVYNNQWAESVPAEDEVAGSLKGRFASYGFAYVDEVDGNDILAVYQAVRRARQLAVAGKGPSAIVFNTFRVGPHGQHEAPDKYVPAEDIERWSKSDRDPLSRFQTYLYEKGILTETKKNQIDESVKKEIDEAFKEAVNAEDPVWDESYEEVFSPSVSVEEPDLSILESSDKPISYMHVLTETLIQEMERDSRIVIFGEDIGWRMRGVHGELQTGNEAYGGELKAKKSLEDIFGHERIFDTSISEEGLVAMGVGMAWQGLHPIVWMQFADFITTAVSGVQDLAARMYWRNRIPLPMIIMMPYGAGTRSGPYHSQDNMAWFCHISGLKIVCPATPYDLSGLLRVALRDENPVLFYVHKTLYNKIKGVWPQEEYCIPFGKARVYYEDDKSNFTIIAWGAMLFEALEAVEKLKKHGIYAEVIDPRTLVPLDIETMLTSFRKTGFALIVSEASAVCGFSAEIAAQLEEEAPDYLAGVRRLSGKSTPVPHAPRLEDAYLPNAQNIVEVALKLWQES